MIYLWNSIILLSPNVIVEPKIKNNNKENKKGISIKLLNNPVTIQIIVLLNNRTSKNLIVLILFERSKIFIGEHDSFEMMNRTVLQYMATAKNNYVQRTFKKYLTLNLQKWPPGKNNPFACIHSFITPI